MSPKYADIIIDISHEMIDRTFQYKVPERLIEKLRIGTQVSIPFGRGNHLRTGYIISFSNHSIFDSEKIKEIEDIVAGSIPIESSLIQLAAFIKERYGSTMINALKTVMPVKEKVKSLSNKQVRLLLSNEECKSLFEQYKKRNAKAKIRLLKELLNNNILSYQKVTQQLKISLATLNAMQSENVIVIEEEFFYRDVMKSSLQLMKEEDKIPNDEQKIVINQILTDYSLGLRKTYLLKGITGSGKTLVYIELIKSIIKHGKEAIVLIPEIGLTYQNMKRFRNTFGNQVTFINSKLSKGERYDQFEKAKKGEVSVMIGPRSALFAPFKNLGIIIIDEEHEPTYKNEYPPKYHAREVAIKRAELANAFVVLGSATPSVDSYYKAIQGEYELLNLQQRASENSQLANVSIVDLRKELKNGNRSIFSNLLKDLIKDRLSKKQQIMLFLNRRGYTGFISCRSCGYVFRCPHCDVSLTEHYSGTEYEKLVCHYCGYEQKKPSNCPKCNSSFIAGFGIGTQKVENQIRIEFPEAKTLRMDMDTTKNKESHEKILSQFENGDADILIGTQMIVKGHDFKNVTLVGVIAADLTLFDNDYLSAERTFDLLMQAAGRAGRGNLKGEVVIQTYDPEHYAITAAANQNYLAFYEEEKAYRSLLKYPPFCHMLVIFFESEKIEKLTQLSEYLKNIITSICKSRDIHMIGPCDATISKINDRHRRVVYLKHVQYNYLIEIKDQIEKYFEDNSEYKDCYLTFDFDPTHGY